MGDVKIFYPEFVPNQILTNTQLNQLREHLESQELHTRLRLSGTGIVCGFNWAVVTSPKPAIKLSGGYGISSDGELIEQCSPAVYTHYRRAYADPDRDEAGALRYLPWRDPADPTHNKPRDIIELIDEATMAGKPEGAELLTQADLAESSTSTRDPVERSASTRDPAERPPSTRDPIGRPRIRRARVLVLYLEHQPVDLNSCLVTSCDNKGLNINVRVRALLLNRDDLVRAPDCADEPVLERIPRIHTIHRPPQDIRGDEELTEAFGGIVDTRAPTLGKNIRSLFEAHAAFLDVEALPAADPLGKLDGASPAQYRYDALADFACAYNEAAIAAYALVEQCCPSGDFPRHLMLGALDRTPFFRNEFLPAAIRNVAQGELERVRMLFLRLQAMINALNFGAHPGAVAIQPSHTAEYPLGRRALPYYFGSIPPDFWRPRPRCAVDADWPWRRPPPVTSPVTPGLDTDYAEASLLRIEGHVGKPHSEAATEIRTQRDAGNVEFSLLRTYFDDRRTEEKALRAQIANRLANLLEFEDKAREPVAKAVAKGRDGFEVIARVAKERLALSDAIDTENSAWLAVRDQRELHCDWAALGRDYLEARSELFCIAARLLGMLHRLLVAVDLADAKALIGPGLDAMHAGALYMLVDRILGAILAAPQSWITAGEIEKRLDWNALPELDNLERLRLALRFALETLQAQVRHMLEKNLPKSLADFDYEVFAARYREVVRGLLEFRLWSGVLGTVLTGATAGRAKTSRDAPLHEVEAGSIEADLLALARSCLAARLATAFSTYETLRDEDLSLYRNLSQIDGLEHLAGVAKGGTFILLCDTSTSSGKVLADFSLERCLPCCCELDADAICLPPLALPDVRVVTLVADKEAGYLPVRLSIFVGVNDYDLNGAGDIAPQTTIELLSDESERGAALKADSKTATVTYALGKPVPGVIDRFRYRVQIKQIKGECSGEAIGEVAVVFAVDPIVTGRIEGSVLANESGASAPGARVDLQGTDFTTVADAKGDFAFGLLLPGTYTARAFRGDLTSDPVTVSVEAGATATARLVLRDGVPLNGTVAVKVISPAGAPIANALVRLTGDSGFTANPTDPKGVVIFQNAPIGTLTLSAEAQGFMKGTAGPFSLAGGETHQETMVLHAASISTPTVTVELTRDTLGVDVVGATAKVRKILADRYTIFVSEFNGATDDPKILTSGPYAKASDFMATGLADPEKTEAQIAADYKDTSTTLAAAAKESAGETRTAYQELLSAVSMAYLDHVAAFNPATLTAEASAGVKTVTAALKTAGLNPTAVQMQWSGEALKTSIGVGSTAEIGSLLG